MTRYLTAGQAAKLLGMTRRTATNRAREAAAAGDAEVVRVGRYWAATEAWWREHLKPKPMGRPRQDAVDH